APRRPRTPRLPRTPRPLRMRRLPETQNGDFATALTDNALAVAGYLLFAAVWTVWVVRVARGRPVRVELGNVQLWAAGVLLLAFTVVRNLPSGGWLHP
ncbi:hypothetical protein ABZS63_41415, partial [Streptomyces sp. NPDC005568]